MTFSFGQQSRDSLSTVHPAMRGICCNALEISPVDITVLEGARTPERQTALYAQGRTTAELLADGVTGVQGKPDLAKVTWTLKSAHIPDASGFSRAVDLAPWPIDWDDLARFDQMALAMLRSASALGVRLRWGADWDGDGKLRERGESDSPHFELVQPIREASL